MLRHLLLQLLGHTGDRADAAPMSATDLILRETGMERMRLQPAICHKDFRVRSTLEWVGRQCAPRARTYRFFDKCINRNLINRFGEPGVVVFGPRQSCPIQTICIPAEDGDGVARIICHFEPSIDALLDEEHRRRVGHHASYRARHRSQGRLHSPPHPREPEAPVSLDLPPSALPLHLQESEYGPGWLIQAVLPVSAMQTVVQPPNDPGPSTSHPPGTRRHYTADLPFDANWPAGVSITAQAIVIDNNNDNDDGPAGSERPARRQRLDTSADVTVTLSNNPEPLCTTGEEGGICIPDHTQALNQHDVLHVDLHTEAALNAVLQFFAADVAVFDPKGH